MNKNRKTDVKLICPVCKIEFFRSKNKYNQNKKHGHVNHCSKKCVSKGRLTKQEVVCKQCGILFFKKFFQIKKYPNHFCSQSCNATYNNAHKTHGYRVSKFEIWLSKKLIKLYPLLEFHFNRKDAINSELDIYIPFLKLAFEINGIFHYEPIFGKEQLAKIENNDQRKFQACIENGIELCLIDISAMKYFKEEKSEKYLDIVVDIINNKK